MKEGGREGGRKTRREGEDIQDYTKGNEGFAEFFGIVATEQERKKEREKEREKGQEGGAEGKGGRDREIV